MKHHLPTVKIKIDAVIVWDAPIYSLYAQGGTDPLFSINIEKKNWKNKARDFVSDMQLNVLNHDMFVWDVNTNILE